MQANSRRSTKTERNKWHTKEGGILIVTIFIGQVVYFTVVVGVESARRVTANDDLAFASRAAKREVVPIRAKRLIPVLKGDNNVT